MKTTDELKKEVGRILIELRRNPELEPEPRVFSYIIDQLIASAKEEGRKEERRRIGELIDEKFLSSMYPFDIQREELSFEEYIKYYVSEDLQEYLSDCQSEYRKIIQND